MCRLHIGYLIMSCWRRMLKEDRVCQNVSVFQKLGLKAEIGINRASSRARHHKRSAWKVSHERTGQIKSAVGDPKDV